MLTIDGKAFAVGGLTGQPEHAYLLPRWLDDLRADPGAFRIALHHREHDGAVCLEAEAIRTRSALAAAGSFAHARVRSARGNGGPRGEGAVRALDGLPLFSKSLSVRNGGSRPRKVDVFICEILAAVEPHSDVETPRRWEHPNLHVETDYAFGGFLSSNANRTVEWVPDPEYSSQVNLGRSTVKRS